MDAEPVITAERAGETALQFLARVNDRFGDQVLALSAVSYMELVHGTHRGSSNAARQMSSNFLADLLSVLPVYSFNGLRAELAGRLDAEQRILGLRIPLADLMIGATALSLNFSILTANERHFRLIPNLRIISF